MLYSDPITDCKLTGFGRLQSAGALDSLERKLASTASMSRLTSCFLSLKLPAWSSSRISSSSRTALGVSTVRSAWRTISRMAAVSSALEAPPLRPPADEACRRWRQVRVPMAAAAVAGAEVAD